MRCARSEQSGGGRYPAGHLTVSSTVERNTTEQPQDEDDDQHQAENATDSRSAIAIVAIVAASAAEQQNQQDDDEDCAYNAPPCSYPGARVIGAAAGTTAAT
jgi:hypothetical protein